MRRLRYQVATSLDGYIAGPNGEIDWIPEDDDIDFAELMAGFDTAVMGRKTFELLTATAGGKLGLKTVVYSKTLRAERYPDVKVVESDPVAHVAAMKEQPGKDIWLLGGGALFRTLLGAGLVDTVEPAIMPVLIGSGIPMLPAEYSKTELVLERCKAYEKSGIVLLEYAVRR